MTWTDLLQSITDSPLGSGIRESTVLFPSIETIHVLMITTVVGTIAIVDLRLLGFASHRRGARQLIKDLLPFTWIAFVGAVITGLLLFTSNAVNYWADAQFLAKMCVLVIAGINMAVFHLTAYQKIGAWDETVPPPPAARVAGALSLGLWILVVILGRWIGFTIPQ